MVQMKGNNVEDNGFVIVNLLFFGLESNSFFQGIMKVTLCELFLMFVFHACVVDTWDMKSLVKFLLAGQTPLWQ